jgi:hypothetical protein
VEHDLDPAARLATALSEWWVLRGRLAGQEPLLRELAGRAEPGSDGWCAAQLYISIRTVRTHLDRIRDKTGRRRGPAYLNEVMKDWMRSRVGGACQIASTSASKTARS